MIKEGSNNEATTYKIQNLNEPWTLFQKKCPVFNLKFERIQWLPKQRTHEYHIANNVKTITFLSKTSAARGWEQTVKNNSKIINTQQHRKLPKIATN
jgi:hypothetical protein